MVKKPKFGAEEDTTPSRLKWKRERTIKQGDTKSSAKKKINTKKRPVNKKREILKPKN